MGEAVGEQYDYEIFPRNYDADLDAKEQHYRAWDVVDEEMTVAVEDAAPDAALDAVESEGFSPVWSSEINSDRIKVVKAEVRERDAYYVEEPPDEVYETVTRSDAGEFLEHRGVDYGSVRESWYYPEIGELVVLCDRVDSSGEVSRIIYRFSRLSSAELELIRNGESLDEGSLDERVQAHADKIEEYSPFSPQQAKVVAGVTFGLDNVEIGRIFDKDCRTVGSIKTQIKHKWDSYRWVVEEGLDEDLDKL